MTTAENLLSTTQTLLDPESLQKFSKAMGVPVNTIREGLRCVLPAFILGLIKKGSSKDGAESLVSVVQRDGTGIDISSESLSNEQHLNKGDDALREIFGKNLNTMSSTISTSTGLNQMNTIKMMRMLAPLVLGHMNVMIKTKNMNAISLMNFLTEQKSIFKGEKEHENFIKPPVSYAERIEEAPNYASKWKLWTSLAVISLICISLLWWWTSRTEPVTNLPQGASLTLSSEAIPTAATPLPEASNLSELVVFLSSGNETELPKHFSFSGTEREMNRVSSVLQEYPETKIRIEAASVDQAQDLKEIFVEKGVSADRIEVQPSELELELVITEF